ncbi:MAG TPA: UvrD-helicase domain-containing protein [Syntrophorhabdaceae bacterium]|jgi:predicted HTH transcriptional regulator|nr:UvrD-helicase domain-containing protein [Syntrophorhabdaceae bacterium]MBV6505535.1 ATP-dependent DNA helicase Rep [Syntrophorhabdaceae bacterium]HNQ62905.1 UvrD-helicase domain-containing protein [Syntrophorhabdaceae bacterium]HOB68624.1 UvrD-helicase domain-containing protein [Syntrophorhabdaceae bacterium]HOF57546.1 UvrD-helicase domain-containing protein [Syntrophorhabdaceae bacterium]
MKTLQKKFIETFGLGTDEEKQKAVFETDGPTLIIAGPGTGKTYTLVLRTLYLILTEKAKPSEIVLTSFTEKSAFELRDRIGLFSKKLGERLNLHELTTGTIHSICDKFNNKFIKETPLKKNYTVLDDLTCSLFINEHFAEIIEPFHDGEKYFGRWKGKWDTIGRVKNFFDKITEELIDPMLLIKSDVYLGIFGRDYGIENTKGISLTEMEFDLATAEHKPRLIFITHHQSNERHPKELKLIKKTEDVVVRKRFFDAAELKTAVYAALINLLEEKELIRTGPFDATVCRDATFDDIDPERLQWFVRTAQEKRGFPLSSKKTTEEILTHLNLAKPGRFTNAAILLFGKQPQRFFVTAEIRCAMFHGNEVSKPIPSYQVYKGDVFQQVVMAVDFVLSRINLSVGDRSQSVDVPVEYEIPRKAVTEAIVNAVAHRDYTSNASVQVMLFRNRLEIWNPGQLPFQLPISKLKQPHASYPANPLIAEPMYLTGFIERMGTGIPDMVNACLSAGLREPELMQEEAFRVILWRNGTTTPYDTPYDTPHVSNLVKRLIMLISGEMSRPELQKIVGINDISHFRGSYIIPALEQGLLEMTLPDKPKSRQQKYRLTEKGKTLQTKFKQQKEDK